MKIDDLFPQAELESEVEGGYVRAFSRPDSPFMGFNYTQKAQAEQRWNAVTLNCRGLIVDEWGHIVARPWPKFFNLAEHDGVKLPVIDPGTRCVTYDKLDGSLIIVADNGNGMVLASRGSFESDQAKWAHGWLGENLPNWKPHEGLTYLFEVIYRENQIVVPYTFEGLVLLGCHETHSMTPVEDHGWPGRVVDVLPPTTIGEAAAMAPRLNAEGVVCVTDTGVRVKIKQADYVEKHRVATNITEKSVWEFLSEDRLYELFDVAPDEFHAWMKSVAQDLRTKFERIQWQALNNFRFCAAKSDNGADRAAFAKNAQDCERPHLLFAMLDGKDYAAMIWDLVKPRGDSRPKTLVEVDNDRLEDAIATQTVLLGD